MQLPPEYGPNKTTEPAVWPKRKKKIHNYLYGTTQHNTSYWMAKKRKNRTKKKPINFHNYHYGKTNLQKTRQPAVWQKKGKNPQQAPQLPL